MYLTMCLSAIIAAKEIIQLCHKAPSLSSRIRNSDFGSSATAIAVSFSSSEEKTIFSDPVTAYLRDTGLCIITVSDSITAKGHCGTCSIAHMHVLMCMIGAKDCG